MAAKGKGGDEPDMEAIAMYLRKEVRVREGRARGKRVEYFRGKRLMDEIKRATSFGLDKYTDADAVQGLAMDLMRAKQPKKTKESVSAPYFVPAAKVKPASREREFPALDYLPAYPAKIEKEAYFVWVVEKPQTWNRFLMLMVLVGIFAAVLHPIWPFWLKIAVWWVSVVLLGVMVGFFTLRLVVWLVVWLVGYDLWIMPNLFDETLELSAIWFPLISIEKSGPGQSMYRLAVILTIGLVGTWIYHNFDAMMTFTHLSDADPDAMPHEDIDDIMAQMEEQVAREAAEEAAAEAADSAMDADYDAVNDEEM